MHRAERISSFKSAFAPNVFIRFMLELWKKGVAIIYPLITIFIHRVFDFDRNHVCFTMMCDVAKWIEKN